MKLSTNLIHGKKEITGISHAVVPDLTFSTTFERNEFGEIRDEQDVYSRTSNPNRRLLESKLATIENGVDSIAFSSGQAATMAIFHVAGGKHVIIPDDMYYNGKILLEECYAHRGLTFSVVDMTNLIEVENAISEKTALIWIETPSNPLLKITDIAAICKLAKKYHLLVACDNTWATPYHTQPFEFGVDIVMHSTTKYMGGHSDILGGCVILNEKSAHLTAPIRNFQKLGGGVPSPFDCWLLNRSLATFMLRMPVHAANAMQLATFLSKHPAILKVNYPGLVSNEYHEVAAKQTINGFGGMISVLVDKSEKEVMQLASSMRIFKHATSLGGVESLVEHRRSVEGTHAVSPNNLLRISVGIEDIQDLIEDFDEALTR